MVRGGKRLGAGLAAALLLGFAGTAHGVNLCTLTGQLTYIDGQPAANSRVYFKSPQLQSVGGTIIPFSAFSVVTDSGGNLPSNPPVTIPQGAYALVTIGTGQPVQLQIPLAASVDLSTLLLANTDPPSLLSGLVIGAGGDFAMAITNPAIGAIGTATLQPGHVTSLQGVPLAATLPNPGQFLVQNAAADSWEPVTLSGDISASTATPGSLSVASLTSVSSPISILGQGNGSDRVANVNLNGEWDVGTFGASASLATTTGTIQAQSGTLTVASAAGWRVGMYANVSGAGAATSLGTNLTAPTAVCGGASCAGSNTFSYQCVAGDIFGGYTASSPTGSSAVVGVASLTTATYVTVTCATVTGATWYGVYRTAVPSGSSQTVGLIGFYSQPNGSANDWIDNGTATVSTAQVDDLPLASPPIAAHADRLVSKVVAISGTALTISPAALTAVSNNTVRHDDTTPIQSALDACNAAGGGIVRLAAGGLSPVTNSGSPYLSTAAYKNLALLFYSNCAIEGSGWTSGLQAESVQTTLYPKNGIQYTGVSSASSTNVTMRDFQVDGNNQAVPFADGYLGSGGTETVQVGIYPDAVSNAAYTDLYVHSTGEDAFYAGNGGYNVMVSASRFSGAGFYDHLGQYRGFEQGCGSRDWKLVGSTIDSNSGAGVDINTECGGFDNSGWVVADNDIWSNGSYAFQIGDAGEAVAGTGTRKGLVNGNNIHDNAGAFYLVAAGSGHAADLGSIKIVGNTISDDVNPNTNTDIYFNCVLGGTCEDIDFTDNDFINSVLPSGSQTAIFVTNSAVSRTLINGNRFKNWNLGSTVPIDDAGTNTTIGCNYFGPAYALECGSWDQGLGHAASGYSVALANPAVVAGNLNFNGTHGTGLANATTNDEAVNYGQLLGVTPLSATTAPIGGSALAAGTCTSATVAVSGATTSMAAVASPVSDPQVDSSHAVTWSAWVSAPATVTVRVCAGAMGTTPNAVGYNVRVFE